MTEHRGAGKLQCFELHRKGKKRPHPSFFCRHLQKSAPCSFSPVRFLPQNFHRPLPAVMQHPQPFTPTSQSRKAARWEEQLRECLCISQRRAATPLENILEQKQQAWSLRVGISTQTTSSSCWGHRKAVWPCLDPPGSAQSPLPFCWHLLTHSCTVGQMRDLLKDPARDHL